MNIKAKLIISVCVIVTMLVSSFPVLAAEGDGVIFVNAAAAGSEVGIKIDGNFSDWDDKAALLSPLYYDSSTQHGGILYRDTDNLYLYIQMSETGYTQFNGSYYRFTVDGTSYTVDIIPNSDGNKNAKVYLNGSFINHANARIRISADNYFPTPDLLVGDQMEMVIPLTYFSSTPDTIVTITFHADVLGSQTISATGTPTMPFVLAAAGLLVAAFGYFLLKRKHVR